MKGRERLLDMNGQYPANEFVLGDSSVQFFDPCQERVERFTFRSFPRENSDESGTWRRNTLLMEYVCQSAVDVHSGGTIRGVRLNLDRVRPV
jgi:hypothetical protein